MTTDNAELVKQAFKLGYNHGVASFAKYAQILKRKSGSFADSTRPISPLKPIKQIKPVKAAPINEQQFGFSGRALNTRNLPGTKTLNMPVLRNLLRT